MTNNIPYRGSPATRDYLAGISDTVANEYAEHQDSINWEPDQWENYPAHATCQHSEQVELRIMNYFRPTFRMCADCGRRLDE